MALEPVKLTTEELAEILHEMSELVSMGDSFEGNISYTTMGERFDDLGPNEWEVRAVYRVGNSQGQGGMRMVGEMKMDVE